MSCPDQGLNIQYDCYDVLVFKDVFVFKNKKKKEKKKGDVFALKSKEEEEKDVVSYFPNLNTKNCKHTYKKSNGEKYRYKYI